MSEQEPERVPTRLSALALARAIRERRIGAREVVEAHIAVLERTQPRTNALAVPRFEAARAEADAIDLRLLDADPTVVLPPLLGVPCTIKEMIGVQGLPQTAGVLARRGQLATSTARSAQRLIDAGAIVLGLTNIAELGIWLESHNRVYGLTRNAYDPNRSAGGSSGGEGVAVGVGGSPIGLGSDMGGSVRLPAFFNGVFGHKPSAGLIPNTGMFPDLIGDVGCLASTGLLTRYAEDLMPALRIIAGPDGHDPFVRAVELGNPEDVVIQGLPVIIGENTSFVPISRQMRLARDRAAQALADSGADVRTVSLRSMRRATEMFIATAAEVSPSLGDILIDAGSPPVTIRNALRGVGGHNLMVLVLVAGERLPRPQGRIRRALAAAAALTEEVQAAIGDGVLLHPPFPRPAPHHHTTFAQPWLQTPCSVFNLMGLPVTQVPLGLNKRGLPLGVQVAAARDHDHTTIAVAHQLEIALGGWTPPAR